MDTIFQYAIALANTLEDGYECPAGETISMPSIRVCNRSGSDATFRIAKAVGGAADATLQYLHYEEPIPSARGSTYQTGPVILKAGDILRFRSSNNQMTFSADGTRTTA